MSTQPRFSVSACLRWLGAALLFGAATTFLVQGWSEVGVLGRELSWAALTLALTLFGIFAVRKLDDAKGARVGLGLAAATIPLHFAEVGGGIWSYRQEGLGSLPALGAAALVLVALAPVLGLGVAALPFVARLPGRVSGWLESIGVLGMAASLLVALPVTAFSGVILSTALAAAALLSRQSGALFAWCAAVALAACSVVAWDSPDVAFALAIVPAGVVHAAIAFHRRSLGCLGLAVFGAAVGLVGQFTLHLRWPAQNAWMIAAGVGVLLLVVASLVDSKRGELERLWAHLSRHFAEEG